jgi:dihydrofolate reductase
MKMFSVIVACSLNGGIGNDNIIPWYIPDDLKHFKTITTSCPNGSCNVVIMGRNTWNSLPKKPLPNRINIVISSTLRNTNNNEYNDTFIVLSFDEALKLSNNLKNIHNVFVIGGCQVYHEALQHPLCEKVYVTHVLKHIQCSVLFPIVSLFETFPVCHEGAINKYKDYSYTFCIYTKK